MRYAKKLLENKGAIVEKLFDQKIYGDHHDVFYNRIDNTFISLLFPSIPSRRYDTRINLVKGREEFLREEFSFSIQIP